MLRVDTVLAPGTFSGENYGAAFKQLVQTWRIAAEHCAKAGTMLVWEFEPGFWLNRPSEVERVLNEVAHPGFGVLFDSSHAFTGGVMGARQGVAPELMGSVVSYAEKLLPFIWHLHLADADGTLHDEDTSTHVPLGDGQVRLPRRSSRCWRQYLTGCHGGALTSVIVTGPTPKRRPPSPTCATIYSPWPAKDRSRRGQ